MKKHNVTTARILALIACALLLVGVVAGCTPSKKDAGLSAEKKAQVEAVAKWYVAQGALDIAGFKGGVYDPDDVLGVATMTAPPAGAKKSEVKWSWVGDTIVIGIAADQTTVTLSPSKTATDTVDVSDSNGSAGKFVMINKDGAWKIDVNKTQEVAAKENSASVPATATP